MIKHWIYEFKNFFNLTLLYILLTIKTWTKFQKMLQKS